MTENTKLADLKTVWQGKAAAIAPAQPIAEVWAEMKAELGDSQELDQFGNQEADYTQTWTGNDSFHAQSIGWKPPFSGIS